MHCQDVPLLVKAIVEAKDFLAILRPRIGLCVLVAEFCTMLKVSSKEAKANNRW